MLPAELMGLKSQSFKQFNSLIKINFFKFFINKCWFNLYFNKKKFNSVIINYDEKSDNLFKWYQQLVVEV